MCEVSDEGAEHEATVVAPNHCRLRRTRVKDFHSFTSS